MPNRIQSSDPLSILYVTHNFPPRAFGGSEIYAYDMACELKNANIKITVVYPVVNNQAKETYLRPYKYKDIQVIEIVSNHHVYSHITKNDSEIESCFTNILNDAKFDIVHFQHILGLPLALMGIAQQSHKTYLTLHDHFTICAQTHIMNPKEMKICSGPESSEKCIDCLFPQLSGSKEQAQRQQVNQVFKNNRGTIHKYLKAFDQIFAPSTYLMNRILQEYTDLDIKVLKFGIKPVKSLPSYPNDGGVRFGFIGNIHPLKNAFALMEVFFKVTGDSSLHIFGTAGQAMLEKIVRYKNRDPRISYYGAYKPEELSKIMSNVDVLVVPSVMENYPLVVREALSAGIPVMASNVGGIPEIINHNKNGYLFDPQNLDELLDLMQKVTSDPGGLATLKKNIKPVKTVKEEAVEWAGIYRNSDQSNNSMPDRVVGSSKEEIQSDRSMSKVSIIIPVFNNLEFTKKCLTALKKNTSYPNYEIIIIDNASTDDTAKFLKSIINDETEIQVISNKNNLGFAKANNQASEIAKGEFLLLLNNDTEVTKNWLNELMDTYLNSENVGIVGAKLYYPDLTIQHAGIYFQKRQTAFKNIEIWPNHIQRGVSINADSVNTTIDVPAVTGAALLISKNDFQSVGMFDDSYPMYFEDIDLNMKILKKGKRIIYCHTCEILHHEGKSSPSQRQIDVLNINSHKVFEKKWSSFIERRFFPQDFKSNKYTFSRQVLWLAPFFNPSGYASESIAFALGLHDKCDFQIRHQSNLYSQDFIDNMPLNWKEILFKIHPSKLDDDEIQIKHNSFVINHLPGYVLNRSGIGNFDIGRTMFETDRLPLNWIEPINSMDEVWVPSKFNYDTFVKSGIKEEKIYIIPESIDTSVFDPDVVDALELPGAKKFNFLSIFEWTERKGADILIKAYFEEFSKSDDVCLYLRTFLLAHYDTDTHDAIQMKIDNIITSNGYKPEELPDYVIMTDQLPFDEMLKLYKACDAFVLPSRGEGWGRPYMEAMAMGLPVIGTNWSGNTEFMNNDNSYLIDIEGLVTIENMEITFYNGHKWAHPDKNHLKKLMRYVTKNPESARITAKKARKYINENFNVEAVADIVINRLSKIDNQIESNNLSTPVEGVRKTNVKWHGSFFVNHSLALVNREMIYSIDKKNINMSLIPYEKDQFKPQNNHYLKNLVPLINKNIGKTDIHINHQWPPKLSPPSSGHWVIIQPWEFGILPVAWAEVFQNEVDECWVPSQYVKQVYIDSGVDEDKVFVVPNGINQKVFNPNVKPTKLNTKKKFKFLFVGGTIFRKGIDVLLNSYTNTFNAKDDVTLIIKDFGGDSFYKGQTVESAIKKINKNPNAPEIIYIDEVLSEEDLVGLYTACDVLAHPYRGEGFGLPILEAMACGMPVIITEGGAAKDFCKPVYSLLVSSTKIRIDENSFNDYSFNRPPWVYEPDAVDLSTKLKFAFYNQDIMKIMGEKAHIEARQNWNWNESGNIITRRIHDAQKKPVVRLLNQKLTKAYDELINGNLSEAKTFFLEILEEKPNSQEALFGSTLCARQEGESETALKMLLRILKLNPNHSEALNQTGLILAETGNLDKAKKYFVSAIQKDPSFLEAQRNYGQVLIDSGDYENGVKVFNEILDNHPEDISSLIYMAGLYSEIGNIDQSQLLINKVLEIDPNNVTALKYSEELLESNGENESKPEIDTLNEKAIEFLSTGEINQAEEIFNRSSELNENPDASFGISLCMLQKGDQNGMLKTINSLIKKWPDYAPAYNQLGLLSFHNKQYDEAQNFFITSIKKDNSFIDAQRNYGLTLIELEDYENGIATFNKILQNYPDDVETLIILSGFYCELEKWTEAENFINAALLNEPENPKALEIMQMINNQLGRN